MASLHTYLRQTQRFIGDSRQVRVNPEDLRDYINQARREVAMRASAIRILPPISGSIVAGTVTAPGSGYTAPTVSLTPPDNPPGYLPWPNGQQATATVEAIGGAIVTFNVNYGGAGYFQPVATISDPTGSGAEVALSTSLNNTLNYGQEVYPFSGIDLSMFPGVDSVYLVRGVSIIFANWRYSLPIYSFSVYQAEIRKYVANQYQYVPTFGAQFGRGTTGSFYLYPPPSQAYQMEWDCQCLPQDLEDDNSVEALPDPYGDAVPFWAAYMACLELQDHNKARSFLDQFEMRVRNFGAYTLPGRVSNPNGRW
jgi:hypothetical protein